jgi:hypothetical protein
VPEARIAGPAMLHPVLTGLPAARTSCIRVPQKLQHGFPSLLPPDDHVRRRG